MQRHDNLYIPTLTHSPVHYYLHNSPSKICKIWPFCAVVSMSLVTAAPRISSACLYSQLCSQWQLPANVDLGR